MNFQQKCAESNAYVRRDFEAVALSYFTKQGLHLELGATVKIGIGDGDFTAPVIMFIKQINNTN
jgi:hypothetical protein